MTRVGSLVSASDAPAETLRLLAELRDALEVDGLPNAPEFIARLEAAARERALPGSLWVGPKDDAVGLAVWEPAGDVGRRVALYLSGAYRGPGAIHAFLEALEAADPTLPLVEVSDQLPGTSAATRAAVFGARGFTAIPRLDLGWPAARPVPPPNELPGASVRPLTVSDAPALVTLTRAAYADNPIDVALFRRWRDAQRDAEAAISYLLLGELGAWNAAASYGVVSDGLLAAATLVNEYHGALITQVMTDPGHRRRGFAAELLHRTVAELTRQAASSIRLVVTRANDRAYRLYRELGFEPVPGAEGVSWLHAGRLGLDPPVR